MSLSQTGPKGKDCLDRPVMSATSTGEGRDRLAMSVTGIRMNRKILHVLVH